MQVNLLNLSSNRVKNTYFGNNYVEKIQPQADIVKKEPDNKTLDNNRFFWGLGALAVITAGGILVYSKFRHGTIANDNSIPDTVSPIRRPINNFLKKISDFDRKRLDEKFNQIELPSLDLLKYLKDADSLAPIRYYLTAKEMQLDKFIQYPNVFSLDNISHTKGKDVSKILSFIFDSNFVSTKYTKGHLKEFVESLTEFSSNAAKKFMDDKTHTFLHFDNASEFLEDLGLKENVELKSKFDNVFKENSRNKITYIVDSDAVKQLSTDSIMNFRFDEEINTFDLSKDIDECEFHFNLELLKESQKIGNELFQYVHPNLSYFFMLKNLLFDKPTENIFLLEGKDKEIGQKVINLISTKTGNAIDTIDCSIPLKDLLTLVIKKGEEAEELYNRTGRKTFLCFDSIEQVITSDLDKNSPEYKGLKDFMENSGEKYHTITVISTKKSENIIDFLANQDGKIFKIKTITDRDKAYSESLNFMFDKMKNNDFSHIDVGRFVRQFITLLASERAGMQGVTEKITNGILLYGSDVATRITADGIKNSVDANYVKITFDKEKPMEIIEAMVKNAEKAEALFNQTGKRTILEMDKLDEMLTSKDNISGIAMIGRFKGLAEHISKDYHTTILLRTSKALDDFEEASIAPHRFGIQMKAE